MKLYLSGPMTGIPDFNKPAFYRAAAELRVAGHEVVNPAEHENLAKGTAWTDFIRKDLVLLSECDGIALLPGWRDSRGARLEVYIALSLGMKPIDAHTQQLVPLDVSPPAFFEPRPTEPAS